MSAYCPAISRNGHKLLIVHTVTRHPFAIRESHTDGGSLGVRRYLLLDDRKKSEDLDPEASPRAKLDKRIKRPHDQVSTPLRQLLDVVRVVGNGALHVDDQPNELVVIAMDDTTGPALIE